MPVYDEIAHIPLMIYLPEYSAFGGTHRKALVQTVDIPVTVLDLYGIPPTEDMAGKSLKGVIERDEKIRDYGYVWISWRPYQHLRWSISLHACSDISRQSALVRLYADADPYALQIYNGGTIKGYTGEWVRLYKRLPSAEGSLWGQGK